MHVRAIPLAFAILHFFFYGSLSPFFTTALSLHIFPRVCSLGSLPATQCKQCALHRRNQIAGKATSGRASFAISSVPAMGVGYKKTTHLYHYMRFSRRCSDCLI
uniref:Putative secreted protein n=1 Tax=Ixodes ricinus TaxID=34613 RepID=A0A6B0UFU3_IXORI